MRVLFDHDVPHELRPQFPDEYEVVTAQYRGWSDYDDDELLGAAERESAVLVTLDTNLVHQQDVSAREVGVVIIDAPIAAGKQKTVVVREDGISVPFA